MLSGNHLQRLDAKTGKILSECKLTTRLHGPRFLKFSALRSDGERVAVALQRSNDLQLFVYDANSRKLIVHSPKVLLKPKERLSCIEYSSQGSFVAIGGTEGSLYLWDAVSGEEVFAISDTYTEYIDHIVFSSDEKRLISGCHYPIPRLRVWDIRMGGVVDSFDVACAPSLERFSTLDITPDGRYH